MCMLSYGLSTLTSNISLDNWKTEGLREAETGPENIVGRVQRMKEHSDLLVQGLTLSWGLLWK